MNKFLIVLILSTQMLTAAKAMAARPAAGQIQSPAAVPSFYTTYPEDNTYKSLSIALNGLTVEGIQYNKRFRLTTVSGVANKSFLITGSRLRKEGLAGFVKKCQLHRDLEIFSTIHADHNSYVLEGEIFPLNRSVMQNLSADFVDETLVSRMSFDLTPDSKLIGENGAKASLAQNWIYQHITSQIRAQSAQIWQTGRVKIDLSGLDAFVCDLVEGKTQLIFGTSLSHAMALQKRTPLITSAELTAVVDKMELQQSPIRSVKENLMINAVLQNEAMKQVINKDMISFEVGKFLKISNSLLNLETGRMRVQRSDSREINRIARSLDKLEDARVNSNVLVRATVLIGD